MTWGGLKNQTITFILKKGRAEKLILSTTSKAQCDFVTYQQYI